MADSKSTKRTISLKRYFVLGEPWVWLTGGALGSIILMIFLLIFVCAKNGLGVFWPAAMVRMTLQSGEQVMGEVIKEEHPGTPKHNIQLKVGNRDLNGLDFKWVKASDVVATDNPFEAVQIEREEYGNFYGFLQNFSKRSVEEVFRNALTKIQPLKDQFEQANDVVADISFAIQQRKQELKKDAYHNNETLSSQKISEDPQLQELESEFSKAMVQLNKVDDQLNGHVLQLTDVSGKKKTLKVREIVRFFQPNSMSFSEKVGLYVEKTVEVLIAEPRESNTEGGLFPAIFGTVMLVILMSILSFPLGVIAGIYLREYAKEGPLVRMIRIAVNNLAGIPSIVYGIFGLGFFVYGVGSGLDQIFFPERLPEPTMGTGGILWASLTLGILTIPVVIVATEEAFGSIPGEIRQNSFALGATRIQTIIRVLLPSASPGIMTGFILAMSRAAGEVAPLMITGVVKLAPDLPLDGHFPFVHMERKFMHLGFHIYDISCQSPNVEAAKPMVYVTTMVLVFVVLALSSLAIYFRNHMQRKFVGRSI